MVLIEMKASVGMARLTLEFIDYFPTVEGGIARNYSALSFDPMDTGSLTPSCCVLLGDFFTDPVRGGNYVIDSPKYALVARFLLDCFIEPCPERKFLEQVVFCFLHYQRNVDIINSGISATTKPCNFSMGLKPFCQRLVIHLS